MRTPSRNCRRKTGKEKEVLFGFVSAVSNVAQTWRTFCARQATWLELGCNDPDSSLSKAKSAAINPLPAALAVPRSLIKPEFFLRRSSKIPEPSSMDTILLIFFPRHGKAILRTTFFEYYKRLARPEANGKDAGPKGQVSEVSKLQKTKVTSSVECSRKWSKHWKLIVLKYSNRIQVPLFLPPKILQSIIMTPTEVL